MRTRLVLLILAASIIASSPVSASTRLDITGVDDETAQRIAATLGAPDDDSEAGLQAFIADLQGATVKAMQSFGYYNSEASVERPPANVVGPSEQQAVAVINVKITPGPATRTLSLDATVIGPANEDEGYRSVLAELPLAINTTFTHADYETSKRIMLDRALERGYFDAKFIVSTARVSRRNNTAEVALQLESGLRYTYATVEYKSDYFDDDFLQGFVPFEYGDPYEARLLAELTQQLQSTGYFDVVRVLPLRGELYGKQVPISVEVTRKDKNLVGLGLGFATDTGWRGKLTWSRPVVNSAGHSYEAELGISKNNQNIGFQYRIPRQREPLYNYWSFETGLQNERKTDQTSVKSTVNVQKIRRTRQRWTESLFVRWERESYEIAGIEDQTTLLLPGISYSRNRSRGSPFPTSGSSINFQALFGSRRLGSDIDFYKTALSAKWLTAIGQRGTLIGALQYGAISSNDFDRVPVTQRFFAGGDRSIRGFPYREIAPVNDEGLIVGGRYLGVYSLEYSHRIRDRWALATFVDAGRAFNNFDEPYSVGAGFGLRWYSPVGPFRIDFAFGVSEDDPPFQLHLSLGPDL